MKSFVLVLALALASVSLASPAARAYDFAPENFETYMSLKKQKIVFDELEAGQLPPLIQQASCVGAGFHCRNSGECCGASFCRDGSCSDSGSSCRSPGASCRSSGECCGSSFCHDGYCGDNGNSCRGEGARCRSSGDCCGSLFCHDGFCG